jgi:hypothetical protein
MAGAIRSAPATKEYRENFEAAMRRGGKAVAQPEERPRQCERCGKTLRVDAECACSALKVGAEARPCEKCGRPTRSSSARFCDYCEFHRGGRR